MDSQLRFKTTVCNGERRRPHGAVGSACACSSAIQLVSTRQWPSSGTSLRLLIICTYSHERG
ncbi:hypothetical protein Mapa_000899 [Marchantia paleacea]|nr:hypothetical protein Mapa_000899 [Marchantia paleacea]